MCHCNGKHSAHLPAKSLQKCHSLSVSSAITPSSLRFYRFDIINPNRPLLTFLFIIADNETESCSSVIRLIVKVAVCHKSEPDGVFYLVQNLIKAFAKKQFCRKNLLETIEISKLLYFAISKNLRKSPALFFGTSAYSEILPVVRKTD